ncbi:MAG: hypothetical protein HYY06_17240 [Deltaproteobacteria bacterium]|nr:hypothetical protein [Deltaproteobacteria bacterium]
MRALPLVAVLLACSCGQVAGPSSERRNGADQLPESGPAPAPAGSSVPESAPVETTTSQPATPAAPLDEASLLTAPARYASVIPRATFPFRRRYGNLVYEGNNIAMRGERAPDGTLAASGAEIAERWRSFARGVRRLIVLRDSLFSQQDHPFDHAPFAVMMPPSWVTGALAELEAGRAIRPLRVPDPADDAAWGAIGSASEMFGSFPPSQRLFELTRLRSTSATGAERARIANARLVLVSLARDARAMVDAAPSGAAAVAEAGAERIAESDRRYFGEDLRRQRLLPIFVENPNRHEVVDEGKGLAIAGRDDVSARAMELARDAIYRRRLRDGDLAIERYDLSKPEERRRAISLCEALLPRGAPPPGGDVWLWVNGPLDPLGVRGEDASAYIAAFRAELGRARVELGRVRFVSKPHVDLPRGPARREAFEAAVDRFRALDLPLSVNLDTRALESLVH